MRMKKFIPVAMACMITFAPIANTSVSAQDNTTTISDTKENSEKNNTTNENTTNTSNEESKEENQKPKKINGIKIRYKTTDKSEEFKGSKSTVNAEFKYERVILKGNKKGIKAINKKLKKYAKNFFTAANGADDNTTILDFAKEASNNYTENNTYFNTAAQRVSYVGKKYISITEDSGWYAGGVHNTMLKGHTFNLKTGKEVKKITRFTKIKSLKKLKKAIKKEVEKNLYESETLHEEAINNKKATGFDFYLDKDGNVMVCFEPYEIAPGGWFREYKLKGRLK